MLLDDLSDPEACTAGFLVVAGEHVDTARMALLVRETSGFVCVAMTGDRLDKLRLPLLAAPDPGGRSVAFAVAVDLRRGVTTGISARDRAATVCALADPATEPDDLARPGHVLPVRVADGGVLELPRPAEAAADLCRAAGLAPVAALATVLDVAGGVAGVAELSDLASRYGLLQVRISEVVAWSLAQRPVRRGATTVLPTVHGRFTAVGYGDADGGEHLVLVRGDPATQDSVLVRVHAECVTGDVVGSLRCSCAAELVAALSAIDRAGQGVLIYLRGPRLAGFGFMRADCGGGPKDIRNAAFVSHVLRDLGVWHVEVLADPADFTVLAGYGITAVGHRRLTVPVTELGGELDSDIC